MNTKVSCARCGFEKKSNHAPLKCDCCGAKMFFSIVPWTVTFSAK